MIQYNIYELRTGPKSTGLRSLGRLAMTGNIKADLQFWIGRQKPDVVLLCPKAKVNEANHILRRGRKKQRIKTMNYINFNKCCVYAPQGRSRARRALRSRFVMQRRLFLLFLFQR